MRSFIIGAAPLLIGICCFSGASKSDQVGIQLTAQCTTDPTQGDGVRHNCETEKQKQTAPANYVIAENSIKEVETSGNGDEHSCHHVFGDYVEVVPHSGITQPKSIIVWANARGPSGHWAGRGWIGCRWTGFYTEYR